MAVSGSDTKMRAVHLVFVLGVLPLASAKSCACNGKSYGRGGIGTKCARWDAPDEKPWCYVDVGACGLDTFESRKGVHWAHRPCAGVKEDDLAKVLSETARSFFRLGAS